MPIEWIASQIKGRQKAKVKLPSLFGNRSIVFPPSLNLEQSSSEETAQFKAAFLEDLIGRQGAVGIDLTGGFGVDSIFLSKNFSQWHYVEPIKDLLETAKHNFGVLGTTNMTCHNTSAETFLENTPDATLVYIDPSRRVNSQKVFTLADCEPDVTTLQDRILTHARHLLVKTSPLHDIQEGIRLLKHVKNVIVLSVANECKEVLFHIERNYIDRPTILAVDLPANDQFTFAIEDESHAIPAFAEVKAFLYEPNSAILKAGAFKSVGNRFGLNKLHPNTHLYTSDEVKSDFPGRIWQTINIVKADKKSIADFLPERKANVLTRNYPLSPDELKKQLGIKDGGELYLIGFTDQKKKLVLAKRLK